MEKRILCYVILAVTYVFILTASVTAPPAFASEKAIQDAPLDKHGWPKHLRFLTGPNGGQWFMLGEPIAEALSHILPSTSRIGGGLDNIININSRNGDLGFSLTSFFGASYSTEPEYQSIETENTIIVANVYPQVFYVLLRKSFAEKHNITSVQSLLNQKIPLRFASLKPGTASEFILRLVLRHGYNTSFEELRQQGWDISFNNYAETADKFVAGELDCFAYTAGTTVPLIHTMESHTDVIILPLEQSVLQTLAEKFHTHIYTIEANRYKSVPQPIQTLGDYTCIIARKDLPDSLIYEVNKILWENKDKISKVIADFSALSPQTAIPEGLPVHPGSIRFWGAMKK